MFTVGFKVDTLCSSYGSVKQRWLVVITPKPQLRRAEQTANNT